MVTKGFLCPKKRWKCVGNDACIYYVAMKCGVRWWVVSKKEKVKERGQKWKEDKEEGMEDS